MKKVNHPILKTLEEVQNYIDNNLDLNKPYDLEKTNHGWLKGLIKRNNWINKIIWRNKRKSKNQEIVSLKSQDDFQKFIYKYKISSYTDLKKKFPGAAVKISKLKLSKTVSYFIDYNKLFGKYNNLSLEEVQTILTNNKITSFNRISRKISYKLRDYILYKGWENILIYFQKPVKNKIVTKKIESKPKPKKLETLEDYQKFIDDNNIFSARNFHDVSIYHYKKALKLNYITLLKFKKPLPKKWGHINSIEDVQNYIIEHNIVNSTDYHKNYPGLAKRASILGINLYQLVFTESTSNRFKSSWEEIIFKLLETEVKTIDCVCDIYHNVTSECKDKQKLEFDIEILLKNNKKIFIEIQGPTHFYSLTGDIKDFLKVRKHDIIKNRWSKTQNDIINVVYFSFESSFGEYPYYIIYKNQTKLVNYIKELIDNDR